MNFKAYDIFSSLIPGFLLLLVVLDYLGLKFDVDLIVAYTAVAFLFGYLLNTISSWLEDFYYFTWNGKPSDRLLDGKDIWKVRFYDAEKVKDLLIAEANKKNPSKGELFMIAKQNCNLSDNRVEDFNSAYAFSRALLTCVLFGCVFLIIKHYFDWRYYLSIPLLIVVWLRCKQRAYFYAREVLSNYLTSKQK
ncbi:MAG: hypothetical protein IPN61_06420 [Bacteroidetes bacterium]|nr:hypothetical protein [Bacteroidota bacterium]